MSFTVTPGQLVQRSEFYDQLSRLTAAGIGLIDALERIKQRPPARSYHAPLARLVDELKHGRPFMLALRATGDFLPPFDTALLHAGEQTGRIDACFRLLADYYAQSARLARFVISQCLYPIGLIHFAVLVFGGAMPFIQSGMTASSWALAGNIILMLAPFYLAAALLVFALQGRHGETWRAVVERILHAVPVLGAARRYLAISRLAVALEALINAGVLIGQAWTTAANASGSPTLRRAVATWQRQIEAGRKPAELVVGAAGLPEMFVSLYATGEVSGKLDESLRQLHTYYYEEGSRKHRSFADLLPKIIHVVVLLGVAYSILGYYGGMMKQTFKALDM